MLQVGSLLRVVSVPCGIFVGQGQENESAAISLKAEKSGRISVSTDWLSAVAEKSP
jgi:hypothetical protein